MADLDRIKDAINIADLIDRTYNLNGQGRYRKAREHDSLVVDTQKQEYWWNSQGEWGDAIDWTGRHILGYGKAWRASDPAMFKEALVTLAAIAGQPEPEFKPEDPQARAQRQSRQRLLELATDYYHARLEASADGRAYVAGRGLTWETAKKYRLGYSDGKLIEQIPASDISLAVEIGILAEQDGRRFDAIPAGCLVYPHFVRGQIAYLSGRATQGRRHHNLYSPKQVFWAVPGGYGGDLIVTEGQADTLSAAQLGKAGLALCGVNLAALDLDAIKLFSRVYLALDKDKAGENALDLVARAMGPLVRLVEPPLFHLDKKPVKDLNAALQMGLSAEAFQLSLDGARTYLEHVTSRVKEASGARRDELLQQLFELLSALEPFPLATYRSIVCKELEMNRVDFDRLLGLARNDQEDSGGFPRGEQYTVKDGWTILRLHNPVGRVASMPLANASFLIRELIEHDNGSGDIFREYMVKCRLADGRDLPHCAVPTAEFGSMKWIAANFPQVIVGAGRNTHDQLREAIQHHSGDIPRRTVYEHTGWREIDGQWCYLTTSGALGLPEGSSKVEVDMRAGRPETNMNRYDLPLRPERVNEAILASLSFWNLTGHTVTVPQWAATYLAPLTPFLPADFALWPHGKSGSFKSVLAALALAHFGDWTGRDGKDYLPSNFLSTANNILMNAFMAKDTLLVIDDFAPGNTIRETRERDEVASRLLRSLGNRAARGRMKDGRRFQADFPPRCLALITAEDVPGGQSILARAIGIRVYTAPQGTPERMAIEERLHQAQETDSLLYRHAMAGYILWIKRHRDELDKQLPTIAGDHRKKFAARGHARLATAFGKLMAGIDTALFFFQDAGAITASQADERRAVAFDAMREVMSEHSGQIESLDPCLIFVETLREELDAGTWYLQPYDPAALAGNSTEPARTSTAYNAVQVGWYDDHYIYLLSKTVNEVRNAYARGGAPFPVGRNTLYTRLEEKGWLVEKGTVYIPTAKDDQISPHVLKIRRSAIYPEEREG